MSITGLKLNFGKDGSVNAQQGKKILPHRTLYIRQKLDNRNFTSLDRIFFQDPVPDHENESTMDELYLEGQLMTEYIKLLKEDTR